MFVRIIIWIFLSWGTIISQAQSFVWVQEWSSMPADTHKLRFLHQQLRQPPLLPPDSIRLLASEGYQLAKELQDTRGIAAMALYWGLSYTFDGQYEEAIVYFQEAADVYLSLSDPNMVGAALTNLGLTHYHLGQEDQAMENYLLAAEQYASIQKPNGVLYNNIAIIYRRQKKYERAIEYYQYSLDLRRSNNDSLGMAAVWFNLANLHLYTQDTTAAITYAQQALATYESKDDVENIAAAHALLGSMFRRTQKPQLAKVELDQAWQYYEQARQGVYYLICVTELAHQYAAEKNWTQASHFYQLAIAEAHEQQAKDELYLLLQYYSEVLQQLGKSSAAYDSLRRSYEIRETLTETQRLAMTEEMQARFEVQQSEQREEMQARHFQEQQRQSLLIMVLIGLLLVGALAFLWINLRKNQRLQQKQREVEEALQAKEAIMQEMHHRVKNNLQFLSSLLRLQARNLEDEKAQEALLHSRSRVLSMALIHNHLYEEEGRTAIRMDAYLKKLCSDVIGSMQRDALEVEMELAIDPVILDVDQAVPVALIAHEATVNAMKYAFKGREKGHILLSLQAGSPQEPLALRIEDDGVGLKVVRKGFGHKLMELMAERLKGSLHLQSDAGLKVHVHFPYDPSPYATA